MNNKLRHIDLYENFDESIVNEALNTEFVKKVNNDHILEPSKELIDKNIKNILGAKSLVNELVQDYVNKLNGYSPNILQQMKNGDGNATGEMYLKFLKEVITNKLNGLGSVTKFAISKYYKEVELKNLLTHSKNKIEEIYDSMLISALMWLHDPNKKNEVLWYDKAFGLLTKRKDSFIKEIIDLTIKSLYK
jgi:hypothetical protein